MLMNALMSKTKGAEIQILNILELLKYYHRDKAVDLGDWDGLACLPAPWGHNHSVAGMADTTGTVTDYIQKPVYTTIADTSGLRCDICSKILQSRRNLRRHMNSHIGLKPHKCKACGKKYARQDTLQEHKQRCRQHEANLLANICSTGIDGTAAKHTTTDRTAADLTMADHHVADQDVSSQDVSGQDVTGHHVSGQDVTGQAVTDNTEEDQIAADQSQLDQTATDNTDEWDAQWPFKWPRISPTIGVEEEYGTRTILHHTLSGKALTSPNGWKLRRSGYLKVSNWQLR
ncbi:hypothetical protein CONLIGDRAFT_12224 [Coniochaeta ligniaria NRRL 30616]|uniref:C2H2-type domain-containing protein n=1 Tax=Coniochaeta ligniaria NRRL 30616 TaxID=1408157 RepID=A0A1J7J5C2_9PEZI|nr:hypothetical protein CONLIGDRAFT_12224 [Coniochaeta ligniaria NRRL 30616]